MSSGETTHRMREGAAKLLVWMASRASRNKTPVDKFCRFAVSRLTKQPADKDFMRDDFVDNDQGFDPDELDRYQRGDTA